jgi:hypothetical protein
METDDNQNVAPEINEEVNNKDVLEESKNVTKEETKNVTKEVQPVDKRSEVPQKVKVTKKVKKFKKLVDIDASQSDSASIFFYICSYCLHHLNCFSVEKRTICISE